MKKFTLFLFVLGLFAFANTVNAQNAFCDSIRIVGYCGEVPLDECETVVDDNVCDHCTSEYEYLVVQWWNPATERYEYACDVNNPYAWTTGFDVDGNIIGGTWFHRDQNLSFVIVSYSLDGVTHVCDTIHVPDCDPVVCDIPEPDVSVSGKLVDCEYNEASDISTCTFIYCIDNSAAFPDVTYLWTTTNLVTGHLNGGIVSGGCFDFPVTSDGPHTLQIVAYILGTPCKWDIYEETIYCEPCGSGCPSWEEVEIREIDITRSCEFECWEEYLIWAQSIWAFDVHFWYPLFGTWEITTVDDQGNVTVLTNPSSPFQYDMECFISQNTNFCEAQLSFTIRYFDEDGCLTGMYTTVLTADHQPCFESCGGEPEPRLAEAQIESYVYPNPISASADAQLNLKSLAQFSSSDQPANVELFNANGQLMKKLMVAGESKMTLDLQGVAPGMYFLKISNDREMLHTEKILILE